MKATLLSHLRPVLLRSSSLAILVLLGAGCESLDQAMNRLDSTTASVNDAMSRVNETADETAATIERAKGTVDEASASVEGLVEDAEQAVDPTERGIRRGI